MEYGQGKKGQENYRKSDHRAHGLDEQLLRGIPEKRFYIAETFLQRYPRPLIRMVIFLDLIDLMQGRLDIREERSLAAGPRLTFPLRER
jgi:hypothetical protein